MYINIPITEVKNIIKDVLNHDHCTKYENKKELLNLTNIIYNSTFNLGDGVA
jgi:hypothetical protein